MCSLEQNMVKEKHEIAEAEDRKKHFLNTLLQLLLGFALRPLSHPENFSSIVESFQNTSFKCCKLPYVEYTSTSNFH